MASAEKEGTPVHTSPEAVVQNGVRSFLNTTHVAALQMQTSLDGSVRFTQRTLDPGEVLRVGKVYVGGVTEEKKWKLPINKSSKEKHKEIKYLLCYDDKDWEILIPFGASCRFYETSTENNNKPTGSSVVKMSDVLDTQKFPALAQMIFGELPALMCYFTGSLHLLGKFEEETIVAATLGEEVNMMFEIGVASSIRYNLALNENHIQNSDAYRRAVSLCQSDLQTYVSNMKLAFTLRPELEELDDLNYDFYDLDSIPSYRGEDSDSIHSATSENLHVKPNNTMNGLKRSSTSNLQTFTYDTVSI